MADSLRVSMEEQFRSKADMEFIAGKRDGIEFSDEELQQLSRVETPDLFIPVKRSLLESLVPKIILVSKSAILSHKYAIDTRDVSDNNNLKIAREVAENVYKLFPQILEEVQKKLGE